MTKETLNFFDEILKTDAFSDETLLTTDVGETVTDVMKLRLQDPYFGTPSNQEEDFFRTDLKLYFQTVRDNWTQTIWPKYAYSSKSMKLIQVVEEIEKTLPHFIYEDLGYWEYLNQIKLRGLTAKEPWPFVSNCIRNYDRKEDEPYYTYDTRRVHGVYLYARNCMYKALIDDVIVYTIYYLIKASNYSAASKRSLLHTLRLEQGDPDKRYYEAAEEFSDVPLPEGIPGTPSFVGPTL